MSDIESAENTESSVEPQVDEASVEVESPEAPTTADPAYEAFMALDEETRGNLANLDEFYKRVNNKSRENAETERSLTERQMAIEAARFAETQTQTAASDVDDLDENARKILDKYLEDKLSPLYSTLEAEHKAKQDAVWEGFTDTHRDVAGDIVVQRFYEMGLDRTSNTEAQFKRNLETAYKAVKADNLDSIVESQVEAAVNKRLAELGVTADGTEVVAVREKVSAVGEADQDDLNAMVEDESIPWFEKMKRILPK